MKNIIFLEGVDGSGKTAIANLLKTKLIEQNISDCIIFDREHSKEFDLLYKIDRREGFNSSKLAKLSYRFSRLNICMNFIKSGKYSAGIFDRGILHFFIKCKFDDLDSNLTNLFIGDFVKSLKPLNYGTVFLHPPLPIIFERIGQKENPSEVDKNTEYIKRYYHLSSEVFNGNSFLGDKIEIDTDKLNKSETCDMIMKFMMK